MHRTRTTLLCLWPLLLSMAVPAVAQEPPAPPPARVVVEPVQDREVARTTAMVGVVDFDRIAGLSAEVSGLIQEEAMVEGAVVRKGKVLLRLNTDFVRKGIGILEKQVEGLDVRIGMARKNVGRFQTLLREEAASEKDYDDLVGALDTLVKEKEALLIQIEKNRLELEKSSLRAPFDGLITGRHRHLGEWVSPGGAVCSLAATADTIVRVAVPEEVVRFVSPGTPVTVKINALEREVTGTVRGVVPVADAATRTIPVKISIPYTPGVYRNLSATADIPVSAVTRLRLLPRDALVRNQGKVFVYTVADGLAKILPVTIEAYSGSYVGVSDPYIHRDMPVVVDGNERLRPGQPVAVVDAIQAGAEIPKAGE